MGYGYENTIGRVDLNCHLESSRASFKYHKNGNITILMKPQHQSMIISFSNGCKFHMNLLRNISEDYLPT